MEVIDDCKVPSLPVSISREESNQLSLSHTFGLEEIFPLPDTTLCFIRTRDRHRETQTLWLHSWSLDPNMLHGLIWDSKQLWTCVTLGVSPLRPTVGGTVSGDPMTPAGSNDGRMYTSPHRGSKEPEWDVCSDESLLSLRHRPSDGRLSLLSCEEFRCKEKLLSLHPHSHPCACFPNILSCFCFFHSFGRNLKAWI